MPPQERRDILAQCAAKNADLQASRQLRVSASPAGADKVVSIRPRKGGPAVKDGPFTESKEVVGGFFIMEPVNVEEALKAARLHQAPELGEQAGSASRCIPPACIASTPERRGASWPAS